MFGGIGGAGDKVLSTNEITKETEIKTVVETYVRETMKLIHIRVSGEEIVTTEGHPFYVKDIGFVNACDLIVGEELVDISGKVLLVEDIRVEYTPEPVKVYNFQVEDYHTYFVGNNNVWVHNAGQRYSSTKEFELAIHNMNPGERVAAVKSKAKIVAKKKGLVKDKNISNMNKRDVYKNPKTKELYSVDTQHGRFEHCNRQGRHLGEVDFDLKHTKSADKSGKHDLIV